MKSVFIPARPDLLPALLLAQVLAWCPVILADTQYASTPYPPGCVTQLPELLAPSDPNVVLAWSGSLTLESLANVDIPQPPAHGKFTSPTTRPLSGETGRKTVFDHQAPPLWPDMQIPRSIAGRPHYSKNIPSPSQSDMAPNQPDGAGPDTDDAG